MYLLYYSTAMLVAKRSTALCTSPMSHIQDLPCRRIRPSSPPLNSNLRTCTCLNMLTTNKYFEYSQEPVTVCRISASPCRPQRTIGCSREAKQSDYFLEAENAPELLGIRSRLWAGVYPSQLATQNRGFVSQTGRATPLPTCDTKPWVCRCTI